jgi:hypothetical protein
MRLIVLVILLSSVQVAICQSDVLKNVTTTEIPIGTEKSPEEVTECNEERQRAIEDIWVSLLKKRTLSLKNFTRIILFQNIGLSKG